MNAKYILGFLWTKACIGVATISVGVALGISVSTEVKRLAHDNTRLAAQIETMQSLLDEQTNHAQKTKKVLNRWQRNYGKLEKRFKENEEALQLAQADTSCPTISMPEIMMKQLQPRPYSSLLP